MKISGGFNTDLPIEIIIDAIIAFIFIIIIFIIQAIFLNKLSKLKTGKKSIAAWIPIGNIYAVGKITINKWIGLGIMILYLLSSFKTTFTENITINGESQQISNKTSSLLPEFVGTILKFVIFMLYIYAIYQFIMLKTKQKELNSVSNENNTEHNNSSISNNSINTSEVKADNSNMKNNSQNVVNEHSVSIEPLPSITENNSTQPTTSKQDSDSSSLQDLYK